MSKTFNWRQNGFLSMVTTWHPTEKVNFKPVPFPFNKLQPVEERLSMKCLLLIQQSCNITHHFFSKHFDQCLTIIMYLMLKGYSSQVTLAICFLIFSVRNLLRSGAIKKAWEPVWFPVVEAFPPLLDTKVNRKAEAGRMQKIIYPEDKFRK